MAEESDATTRQQTLDLTAEEGPAMASSITKVLGLTTTAVRRHIILLLDSKEIAEHEPNVLSERGCGRPARHHVVIERIHVRLANGYSDLVSKALGYPGQLGGHETVESLAVARSREIERRYAPIVCDAGSDPWACVQVLADAFTQDGYTATVRNIGGGALAVQLYQGHHPIQNVAGDFPQLYDVETLIFGKLLDVHVRRLSMFTDGGHVCTTHIPVSMPVTRPRARNV